MPFLTEPEPQRDVKLPVLPGISRLVANNPGPMTYFGTNTYLIETPEGLVVLDPGPDGHPEHVDAIMRETGGKVALILASHTHHDHVGAVPALKQATGAPVAGFHAPVLEGFKPDIGLDHEGRVAGMTALHTPGHLADHLCFAAVRDGKKVLFSADHVMSWSTSVVSPPGGNMRRYFDSLDLLLARDDDVYLPGHGPPLPQPRALVQELLHHRIQRETAILDRLQKSPAAIAAVTDAIYVGLNARLRGAAERNVLAHLLKLEADGKATREGEVWRAI